MRLQPLGDQAVLAYWPDEAAAVAFAGRARALAEPWLLDVVVAYTSVAVFFDLDRARFDQVAERLRRLAAEPASAAARPGRLHRIPCCYALGPDLDRVARHTGLSPGQVIELHTGNEYVVYAIGFSPGFPYLGYLPEPLCGVPRLESPRLRVEPGSVGLTGRQTGIYPEPKPGGWNLIGRTPLELVSVADVYFPLCAGDRVRFEPIGEAEFHRLLGRRLDLE
jgi:inhibitor of KinA